MHLDDSITTLPQISDRYQALLAKLEIHTIRDLLTHFPRYHKDTSDLNKIGEIASGGNVVVQAYPKSVSSTRIRGGRTLQKAILSDETGSIAATWFNQPYLQRALKPDTEYIFFGGVKQRTASKFEFYPTSFEPIIEGREQVHLGRISPQYPLTGGVSIKWLRNRIKYLVDRLEAIESLHDGADQALDLINKEESLTKLIHDIHFPEAEVQVEHSKAILGLLELTQLQLQMEHRRRSQKQQIGIALDVDKEKINAFINSLSFKLTSDQSRAVEEILHDLGHDKPMNRLLQGDVGSGKTIVAVIAALAAKTAGYQTAILAPTTVLANQHYAGITKLLDEYSNTRTLEYMSTSLVTSSTKQHERADIVIGTSAVLARKDDLIDNLGLVIVDEQHRFGVGQREELLAPFNPPLEKYPHFLDMTATPIPRTMALGLFGDIEISNIFTKPAGRLPIQTRIVPEQKRIDSYDWITRQVIDKGEQVYWICPLIEESDKLEVKSAKEIFEKLSTEALPHLKVELLHGKMKPKEKEDIMSRFAEGEINVLVSTSVIEVGIDVPNATVMVIEGVERFGLAQLHQIRGRVGRSDKQSWCFLFPSEEVSDEAIQRLEFFAGHTEGLQIAEFDLSSRGPGEVYGKRQSGVPNLKLANLTDIEQVKKSKQVAVDLYEQGVRKISLFASSE